MHRFTDILFCPMDGHDNRDAAQCLAELRAVSGAKLSLLGVAPEPTRFQRLSQRHILLDAAVEAERARLQEELQRCADAGGVDAPIATDVGDPAVRIVQRVLKDGHDLVVITRDHSSGDRAVVRRLLRKCPCPVWVIRPRPLVAADVLAAVNPDPSEAALNATILELASSMTDLTGGKLHVVHGWEFYGESTLRHSAFVQVPAEELDSLVQAERDRHEQALDDTLKASLPAGTAVQTHLLHGPPHVVVPALVERERMAVLVMGTVARQGLSGMVMGNTAERILDEVDCSIVAVKPPGFDSPIGVN